MALEKGIEKQIVEFVQETPKALGVLVASFLSGHLWVFVITAFRKKTKGNNLMHSLTGRTAIGLAWLTVVLIPVYRLKFGDFAFDYDKILQVTIPTIVVGAFVQLVFFALFVGIGDRR